MRNMGSPVSDDSGDDASDSGYESRRQKSAELPQGLIEKKDFKLQVELAFITYTKSRFHDKMEFFEAFKRTIEPHLPRVSAERTATVEIFGSKELHQDGTPHYHVVVRFSPRVHWENARDKLAMWIDVNGERVADTRSIRICTKKTREPSEKFLNDVQAYVAKDGDVFGEWIGGKQSAKKKETEMYEEELEKCEYREDAEQIMKDRFRKRYIWQHVNVRAYLNSKKPKPPLPFVLDFEVKQWRVPRPILQWRKRNFVCKDGVFTPKKGHRHTSLVIIGPPRSGKTSWAGAWGKPTMMNGGWDMGQLLQDGSTHLVMNDVDTRGFRNKRELAGCQKFITATGKYRDERTIPWGKPVIWTCNEDNSVLRDRRLATYLAESEAVIVKLGAGDKLYQVE